MVEVTSEKPMSVLFGGGTGTIGGNAVVLRVGKENVSQYLFDFGVNTDKYHSWRTLNSEPRSIEDLRRRGLVSQFDLNFRAAFLSHAHPDHYLGLLALYKSKYKLDAIWSSKTTSRLVKEIQFVKKPFHLDAFVVGDYYEDSPPSADLTIKISVYPVDHDVPGACCFFVIVNGSMIIYTGDFRDHGFLSQMLERQFWEYADLLESKYRFHSRIVICEGTNFGLPFDLRPQKDIDDRLSNILTNYSNDLVALIINHDGLWDFFSAVQVAKQNESGCQRKIVLCKTLIGYFEKIQEEFIEDYRRVVSEDNIDLFMNMLDCRQFLIYDPKKDDSLDLLRKIADSPSAYLLLLTRNDAFSALERIAAFSQNISGCCILSFSASDSAERIFAEYIGHLGFCVERTNAFSRGHVSPHNLVEILKRINPTKVFIMHTLAPKGLKKFLGAHLDSEIITPIEGIPYAI